MIASTVTEQIASNDGYCRCIVQSCVQVVKEGCGVVLKVQEESAEEGDGGGEGFAAEVVGFFEENGTEDDDEEGF